MFSSQHISEYQVNTSEWRGELRLLTPSKETAVG